MGNKNGYLARRALAAIPIFGLLLLAVSGPAFAGVKDNNFHGRYLTSYHGFDSSITVQPVSRTHQRFRLPCRARCLAMAKGLLKDSRT